MSEYDQNDFAELFVEDELVQFEGDQAIISFSHDWFATQFDIDSRRNYTQAILSARLRREIPLDEIEVGIEIGDTIPSKSVFAIKLGQPLYIGLRGLYENNPGAIHNLIGSLYKYRESHQLVPSQATLLFYAVNQLEKLVDIQG